MIRDFTTTLNDWQRLGRYGVVVALAVLISLLYPSNVKFKYEFQKGQTWRYDNLVAPFDIPIKKSELEIREDREKTIRDFSPYYRFNEELDAAHKKDFEAALLQEIAAQESNPEWQEIAKSLEKYLTLGNKILESLYNQGIIEFAPEHRKRGNDFVINVIKGNVTYKRTMLGCITVEEARNKVVSLLEKNIQPNSQRLFPLLSSAIAPNLVYDEDLSNRMLKSALSELVTSKGLVRQGELIVQKGGAVTDDVYDKLVSFRAKFEEDITFSTSPVAVYFGYLLLTSLVLWVYLLYIGFYRREILLQWNYLTFVLVWLLAFSYLTYLVEQLETISAYAIPFCIVPIIVRHFFTYRLAFFTHVVVVLIASLLTSVGYQFTFMQIVAGVVAVLAVADARDWMKFFKSVLYILMTYVIAHVGMSLIEEGAFREIDWTVFSWLLLNGLLTLLAFPLIPLAERLFGFTSSISLVELSDMNRPLLRELAMKAPGTLQHSLQVANLAEAAATETGANPLLVRVGALYHDVGKTLHPEFFVENQSSINPHEKINREESARIIIEHVTEGVKLAKKHGLPKVLTDFILTHHGTTKVEYFYRTFVKENPGIEVDETKFTYPGPKPSSKEEAILMLADSIEATARSLPKPTTADIDELVNKIIAKKLEAGQLQSSRLTFGELEKCREIFKRTMRSIYHLRIEYPDEVKQKNEPVS
jgi:hypothetical protein